MLRTEIHEKVKQSPRLTNLLEKNLLRVLWGDITTQENRSGKNLTDEQISSLIRKMVITNEDNLKQMEKYNRQNEQSFNDYKEEISLLKVLLPKTLTQEEIEVNLVNLNDWKNLKEGVAIGMAMKHFKSLNKSVLSEDVMSVVKKLRG